jgi:hypothetical protein
MMTNTRVIWESGKWPLLEVTHTTELGPITLGRKAKLGDLIRYYWYFITHIIEDAEELDV